MTRATRPQLVVFDIDGTLHDFARWWPRVLRQGLADFGRAQRFAPVLPDDASANAVVGNADAALWAAFLPAPHKELWPEFRALVLPRELDELRRGEDFLFPGTRALLDRLRDAGVRTALASNCRNLYLAAMLEGQGLARLTDAAFCLDTPGVRHKTDMVARALADAATDASRAAMVGDRASDLEAARANDLRFVWRHNPFVPPLPADLTWQGDPEQLLSWLGVS